jgi:microcystin-dependent protein
MSIAGNSSMYGIMGTTYGSDKTTTFAFPDLQGPSAATQVAWSRIAFPSALPERFPFTLNQDMECA